MNFCNEPTNGSHAVCWVRFMIQEYMQGEKIILSFHYFLFEPLQEVELKHSVQKLRLGISLIEFAGKQKSKQQIRENQVYHRN